MALNNRPFCVWFDLDDTLITTSQSLIAAVNASTSYLKATYPALTDKDVALQSMDVWLAELGPGTAGFSRLRHMDLDAFRTHIVEGTLQRLAITGINAQDLLRHSATAEEAAWVCYPGVLSLLDNLKQRGVPIGLISNGPTALQHQKLRKCGLLRYFDNILLDSEIGVSKPDREIFQAAVELQPKFSHVMIGNDPDADIDGALMAGWKAIWFTPGWEMQTKPSKTGYISIQHHDDVLDYLTQG